MRAIQKINNNVALCADSSGRRVIALGKGIGFGVMPRTLALSEIDRTFYELDVKYLPLLRELSEDVLALSIQLIDKASDELPYQLNPNVVLTLADHIAFALERHRKGIRVQLPLYYDVAQMYPKEIKIGLYALKQIRKDYRIILPEEEAAGIALNLVNSKVQWKTEPSGEVQRTYEEMLRRITDIVEQAFGFTVERESFNYARFATHLYYLFQRIYDKKMMDSDNFQMYAGMQEGFPDVAACVNRIGDYLKDSCHVDLNNEERLYLMLHVNRICTKEGL